jgi:hypothetical protein
VTRTTRRDLAPHRRHRRHALTLVFVLAITAVAAFAALAGNSRAQGVGGVTGEGAPINTARPKITGVARQGQTLTAHPGRWVGTRPITYAYRWLRCVPTGPTCVSVETAVNARYTLASADVGASLRVVVVAITSKGSGRATSVRTGVVQPAVQPLRTVALWNMDEVDGTVMHDSAGGHDGSVNSVILGLPGASGSAFGFNGLSSFVEVPSAVDLNPGNASIVASVRLSTTGSPPSAPGDWDLLRKGDYDPTSSEYKIELQHSGQASCGFEGAAGYSEIIAGPAVNDGQWHLVQCVKAQTEISLIVDGSVFSQAANVGSIENDAPVVIGGRPGADWYRGTLDDVRIQIGVPSNRGCKSARSAGRERWLHVCRIDVKERRADRNWHRLSPPR